MQTIKVSIDPVGRATVEAFGIIGGKCLEKSRPIVDALRDTTGSDSVKVVEKPEMYQEEDNQLYDSL